MNSSTTRRNQIFNYLYVLAIIMVVDNHTGNRIGILSNIFPYNSFYMPLFVFCSGYFYKKNNLFTNIKHKIKKLLIPYIVWNIIALLTAFILDLIFNLNWFPNLDFEKIILMFICESPTSLNGASWFIIMLFWVSIFYNIVRLLIKDNKLNDIILTIFHLIIGFIAIYLCTKGYSQKNHLLLFVLKIGFYIQFYHYGYIFKKYIEKRLLKCDKLIVCGICVLINLTLIYLFGNEINFYSTSNMGRFTYWFLPVITSITGIIFWYEIMEFISRKIGENKIINFISRNTLIIMEIHLLFANIPNLIIYTMTTLGSTKYLDFNIELFRNSAWIVSYNNNTLLYSFFFGIIGSLLVAFLIEKVKSGLINNYRK